MDGFALRCFQRLSWTRLSYPAVLLAEQPVHQRPVQHGPLVLVPDPLKSPTPATDRDRTVSRRSEPSSRATLIGEQPNPWDLLQPQDVTSRHRGAKPLRRYELLGGISLLSPEYLLSFERCPFHTETPDHYALVSYLLDLCASQSSALSPLHSQDGYQSSRGHLWKPPLRFWRRPPQSNYPPSGVPPLGVRAQTTEGPYFNVGSPHAGARGSLPPAYPTHRLPRLNAKLQ